MSWPQWSSGSQPSVPPVLNPAAPVINSAPSVVPPGLQYTPDQWAQLQQQNWNQWAQWQQQYQQWHQQYGAEYQKSMNALAQAAQQSMAGLPNVAVPPPLPAEVKPPLPADDPPPPIPSYSTAPPPAQPVNYNTAPPPPRSNDRPPVAYPKTNQNQNWQHQSTRYPNEVLQQKRVYDQSADRDAKRPMLNKQGWQSQPPIQTQPPPPPMQQRPSKDNLEELTEAERKFDKQFAEWEAQFNKWKEQNAEHPDKEQYREYEKKWESWRAQLLERREQMRRKRLSMMAADSPNRGCPPVGGYNQQPSYNSPQQSFGQQNYGQPPPPKPAQNTPPIVSQKPLPKPGGLLPTPHSNIPFNKPPPTLNDEPLKFKQNDDVPKFKPEDEPLKFNQNDEPLKFKETEPQPPLPEPEENVGDFIKPNTDGGIPGLDLVKDDPNPQKEADDVVVIEGDQEKKGPDFDAISKGINTILGDQKLLNMLSIVSQNQNANINDNLTNTVSKIKDTSNPDPSVPIQFPEQSNQSFDDHSNQSATYGQREFINNFDDQTRSSFTMAHGEQDTRYDASNNYGRNQKFEQSRFPNRFNNQFGGPDGDQYGENDFNDRRFTSGRDNFDRYPPKGDMNDPNSEAFGPIDRPYGGPRSSSGDRLNQDRGNSNPDRFSNNQERFGPNQDRFGPNPDRFGPNQKRFGVNQDRFGPNQDRFGPNQDRFGPNQDKFGSGQDRFGPNQDKFGPGQERFGPNQDRFGPNQDKFGPSQDRFGPNQDKFGPNGDRFGPNQDKFGPNGDRFGPNQDKFGPNPDRFGLNQGKFGPNGERFGPNQDKFGPNGGRFGPNQDKFGPNHERFSSTQDRTGPGFGRNQDRYEPNQDRYGPGQDRFKPNQNNRFEPNQDRFGPGQDRLGPAQDRYGPVSQGRFGPGQDNNRFGSNDRFAPKQDRFGPNQDRLGPNQDRFGPKSDRFAQDKQFGPSNDFKQNLDGGFGPNDRHPGMRNQGGPRQFGFGGNNFDRAQQFDRDDFDEGPPPEDSFNDDYDYPPEDNYTNEVDDNIPPENANNETWKGEEHYEDTSVTEPPVSDTNVSAPPPSNSDILQPATVIDYEHKSLKSAEAEVLIEPIYMFDYRHKPLSRIPLPQRPKWLTESVRNIREFDPPVVRPYEPPNLRRYPPPVDNWRKDRYADDHWSPHNRWKYNDNRPSFEERRPYNDRSFEESKPFNRDWSPAVDKRSKQEKSTEDLKQVSFQNSDFGEEKISDTEWPDDDENDQWEEPQSSVEFPSFQKPDSGKSSTSKSAVLIEDLINPPGRYNRPPRIVIILRGPPGSGKTFLAKLIKDKEVENGGSTPRILSLDDYFMVEQEKEITEEGKKVKIKEMVYEYEAEMEESYRTSLIKSFKKTVTDGYFSFIIVDNVNDKVKYFGEMWSFAKQNGFQVYICQLDLDVQTCSKRNIHGRSEEDIEKCVEGWEPTPAHHPVVDATSLLQSASIPEVEMEEVNSPESDLNEHDGSEDQVARSKWDNFDCSVLNLAKLDGVSKPLRHSRTMEEYLQLDTEWTPLKPTKPGQKRVRWADLEEQKQQEKMRAIGFVVGQTNWERMMDPTGGSSALTQTKYIERTGRYKVDQK